MHNIDNSIETLIIIRHSELAKTHRPLYYRQILCYTIIMKYFKDKKRKCRMKKISTGIEVCILLRENFKFGLKTNILRIHYHTATSAIAGPKHS